MARYDFVPEYVGPGLASQIGGGVSKYLEGMRRKKAEEKEQSRYDAEQGFKQRAEARDVEQQDANLTERGFSRGDDSGVADEDNGGLTPYQMSMLGQPTEGDLREAIDLGDKPAEAHIREQLRAQVPPTSSTAQAIGGLRYNYKSGRDAQAEHYRDELGDEDRASLWTHEADRRRERINSLSPRVENAGDRSAIVDNDLNYRDVNPEYTDPGYFANRDRLEKLQTSGEVTRDLARERARRTNNRTDPEVRIGELKGLVDAHRNEVALGERQVADLEKAHAVRQQTHPDEPEPQDLEVARRGVAESRKRFAHISKMATTETERRLGVDPMDEPVDPIAEDRDFIHQAGDADERARRIAFVKQRRGMRVSDPRRPPP